ncbi:MAG: hypothetical protein JSS63_14570 [Bacteroidetes bacterium]|nr:hypothetical protein [Bacteroidota bacterium]
MLPLPTVEILKKLNSAELKRFGDFVKSPYFNSISALEIIYDAVSKSYPDFEAQIFSFEKMSKKIFGKGEIKEKRVKNLYADFGNLLRKFLGQEELIKKAHEMDIFIAEGLSNKGLPEEANKFINKSLEQNDNGYLTDDRRFEYRNRMKAQKGLNLSGMGREHFASILKIIEEITEAKIVNFLRDVYAGGNAEYLRNDVYGNEPKKNMNAGLLLSLDTDKFLDYLKAMNSQYYSYLKIFYLLFYHTVYDINREQFYELKKLIFENIHGIEKWEAYNILLRLNEIINFKMVPMDSSYTNEIMETGKLFTELKIFPDHAHYPLHAGFFRDVFTSVLNLKEYDWAEKFVNEYSQYLIKDLQDEELNYCSGVLNFIRGRYETSLDFFSKVKPAKILVNINVRFYYIMNYIELKAYESARSAIHAFKQFYKDNEEIPKIKYTLIPDALKYLTEIIRCEEEGKKFDEFLHKEANDGRSYFQRSYILEKIEKMR